MKLVVLLLASLTLHATQVCEITNGALMRYEDQVLQAAADFAKSKDSHQLLRITEPLACMLEIQQKSEGELKVFASNFLRPLLGGPQNPYAAKDPRYAIVANELTKITLHTKDLIENSVASAHARGLWGFYKLFCEQGNVEFCARMLPDDSQIRLESPLLAASSMMTLRQAYFTLKGKQREEVAERIRQLYKTVPFDRGLKRRMIDEIYAEIFPGKLSLSLQS